MIYPMLLEFCHNPQVLHALVATVLTDMLGVVAFTDTLFTDHGLVPPQAPRTFTSFNEAAEEAAISRLYAGIHYPPDNNNGLAQGQCIGQVILGRMTFRP